MQSLLKKKPSTLAVFLADTEWASEVNYYEDLGGEDRDSERVGENRDPASEDRDPASDYVDPLIEDRAAVSEYDQDPISKDEDQDAVSECDDQDPVSKDEDQDAASECEDQDAGSECEDQDAVSECEDQDAVSECEDQDAVSECEDQDAVSEGEAQDPVSKGEAQDPVSECEDRDSVSECEDQDSVSECEDQDAGSECEDRDSVSECEDQDAGSECEDQDSVSECEDQDSVSECEDQDAVRECEDQDAVSECEDQNAVSECEDQDSVSECEDQDAVSECGDQDPVSKGEAQDPVSECEDRDPVREDRDPASENGDPLSEDPGTVSEGKDQDAGRDFAGEAQDPVIEVEDRDLIRKDEDPDTLSEDRGAVTEGKEHDPLSEDRDRFSQRDDRDIVRQCENDKVCQGENRHTDLESEDRNYESELDERNFISQDKIKDTVSKGTDADRIEISDEDFVSSHYSSDSSIVSIIKEKCTKIKLQCKKTSQRKFVNPLCQSKIKKREFTGKYDHSVSSESSKTSKEEAKSEKGDKSRKRIKRKHARKTDRDINCPAESESSDSSESSKTSKEEAKSEKDDKSRKRIKRKHARKPGSDINCTAESESNDSSESSKTSKEKAKYENSDKSRKRIKRKHARKPDRDINCTAESESSDSSESSKTSKEEAKSGKGDKSRKRIKRKHARKPDRDINCTAESESSDSSEKRPSSKFVRSDINNKEIYVRKLLTSSHTASGKKKASDRVWNQSHSCLFCKKVISNIAKHLRKHRNRPEITEILAVSSQLGPKNKKTRAMWDIVRNKGDHEQNMRVLNDGKGEFIVGRRHKGKFDVSHYGPCPECYVWLKLDTSLVKHQNVCPCRILETSKPVNVGKRELFIMSLQVSGKISSHASKALQNEVFSIMTLDNVSEIAQTDKLIISLGNMWLLKNAGNLLKRKYYTSSHMRGAARLLMNVRQLAGMPAASYTELLVPSHFDNFVKGALITASPEIDDDEDLKFPSTALKIGYDLKRLVGAKWGIALRERDSGAEEDCKKFLKLMKFEWSVRVSKQALITLQTRKFNAEKSLPEPDDLVKLNKHIKDELKNLNLKDQSYQTWRRAEVLAQARLLVFNKRRSGEVDVIRVKDYLRRKSGVSTLDKAMRDKLSPVEVKLLESHDLMEVRGKFGRGVPVIIPADLRKVLAYLSNADVRLASGVLNTNHYLFPNKANGVIRAYDSLKLMCEEAALKQPERITSVCLRKYMATVSQVFDLNVHQLEWVSNHLGHSVDIHKIHYRQTSGVIERVDMSKLMLLQEYNMTAKFAGKSLAEIQFPDLVFSQDNRHEDTVCTDDGPATDEGVSSKLDETCVDDNYQPDDENYQPDESKDETFDEYDFLEDDGEQEVSKKRKAISTRQKWTKEELAEVQMYFKEHLSSKTTPGRQDCVRAIDKSKANNGTLQRRSWETLKKKVWNLIQKSK